MLNEQEHKLYSNAKVNLWKETHKEYLSNENIKKWCDEIKKYSPNDFFANFYEITTFSTVDSICEYLINYLKNNNFVFADEVVRYLIKTIDDPRIIGPTIAILDEAKTIDDKYRNSLNELSLKLDNGVFNVDLIRDVFVCYSSKDIAIVSDIVNYLEYNDLTCFVAQRNLRHGKGAKDNLML